MGAALMLWSCEGPQGPPGPAGQPGDSYQKKIYTCYVNNNNESRWQRVEDENGLFLFYRSIFEIPAFTKNVFDTGMFMAYVMDGDLQQPLPFEVYNEYEGVPWQYQLWCDFVHSSRDNPVGTVAFYYQDSEFNDNRPPNMEFRVVLMW